MVITSTAAAPAAANAAAVPPGADEDGVPGTRACNSHTSTSPAEVEQARRLDASRGYSNVDMRDMSCGGWVGSGGREGKYLGYYSTACTRKYSVTVSLYH